MKYALIIILLLSTKNTFSQMQDRYWYFGRGTDGIFFDNQNLPVKLTNKRPSIGFEGNGVGTDPCTGQLLFYTDGIEVVNSNHALMLNGGGMLSNPSGSQCVKICKIPGTCSQYYVISNSSWDNTPGSFYYSIVDFTSNPLGQVTLKNQLISGPDYHQAMKIIPKTNSNNMWLIGHLYNTATYHVFEVTPAGFIGPVVYNFSNSGRSWTMEYNEATQKLVNMGEDNIKVTLFDFDPATGVLSNEQQVYFGVLNAVVGNFSPDGSKLYVGLSVGVNAGVLWQYDLNTSVWTNMNTCCWAHDVKTGPDGKTYYIHTFNNPNPLAVMSNANLTAIGNACGYSTIVNPGNFNGEVRRFPEFIQAPDPPIANLDTLTINAGSAVSINVLNNDTDPQGDILSLTSIVSGPLNGSAVINGNQIIYTPNVGACNITDTLTYEIVDNTCLCDTAQIIINIFGSLPVSSFTSNGNNCSNTISFTNLTQNASMFFWNFGDGSPVSNSLNPIHTYQQTGSYPVMLIAANGCGTDSIIDTVNVMVGVPPNAAFTSSQFNCSLILNFTNQSSVSNTYLWDFGDGFSDTASSPSHSYLNPGTYNVLLIASNNCDSDTISQQVQIIPIPQPEIMFSAIQQNCSLTVNFSGQISNAISYYWDLGDGSIDSSLFVSHTYLSEGMYMVRLIAQGSCVSDTLIQEVNVISSPSAIAQFEYQTEFCSNKVNFLNQSDNSLSYIWDFGDSNTSNSFNPQHIYADTGYYMVRLIAENQCGVDTMTRLVVDTFSKAHSGFFHEQPRCDSKVQFYDESINAISYHWNFGDGVISNSNNPSHGYRNAGEYLVTLCVNRGTICADTTTLTIRTEGPFEPQFYIPNCFTPNGDGLNEIFRIISDNNCDGFQLYIFNRWGEIVYESNDIYLGWDGIVEGNPVQEGVYCYLIKGVDFQKTGSVAVLR